MVSLDSIEHLIFHFKETCFVCLLDTCPISWNMFAAFTSLFMSLMPFIMLMQTHLILSCFTVFLYQFVIDFECLI